uniref:BPTI/Kunitz inhibitor domain-containing protein n=1 Tax=Enterobius vermicularis TaxID=51028 RepID=A0A0N4UTF0_ENTVE
LPISNDNLFLGYNGDEEKNGYKSIRNELNIRTLGNDVKRSRRQSLDTAPVSMEQVIKPIRFDGEMPGHYVRATAISNPIKSNPCALMVDPGPCKEAHLRYFFEKKTKKCKLFYYGGCEGNANNFATELECEQKCVKQVNQLEDELGLCPNGKPPLGDNVPVLCGNLTESTSCPLGYYCKQGVVEVCCPDEAMEPLELQKILIESKKSTNIRYAPATNRQKPMEFKERDVDKGNS